MDRSKLETLVSAQKEQLARYEKRLKDVVTAYKGLLKEKEALESSLAAVTASNNETNNVKSTSALANTFLASESASNASSGKETNFQATSDTESGIVDEDKQQLQKQILTLMNSLATLSAEKSRMEASFQADKRQLRGQLTQKDQIITTLKNTIKENEDKAKAHLDEMKAKWIIECQEREKETNNQMVMIRELQKLYADERHLKENIEMQLNNFKTQFASNETENVHVRDLQIQLKEAKLQLRQMQASGTVKQALKDAESAADSTTLLKQVQQQMQQLKDQHAVAIKNEQRRVLHAEERSRHQAALHEDRVANLEARLAELSSTVGNYDRLRQQDQESIQTLRKKLQELEHNTDSKLNSASTTDYNADRWRRKLSNTAYDIATLADEILRLKKLLLAENSRSANPIDLSKIFSVVSDHTECREELEHLQQQYDSCKTELLQYQDHMQVQKSHISTLQDKVKVLNRNIDEQELELKNQAEKLRQAIKEERTKWKSKLNDLENETRCKVVDLEQQLQKQRQRSLHLLDEKEQEIKTLQTSFEVFHSVTLPASTNDSQAEQNVTTSASDAESNDGGGPDGVSAQTGTKVAIRAKKLSIGDNCHMLHYANELARKDIEIAGLRKAKYAAESSLRKAIQEKVNAQEDLCDKVALLEEQVDRLERCKTREGANLEYLKNVIISYIVTRDPDGKRHMLNAISAVLQLTPAEMQTINNTFQKK
ncbi:PREDICTED: GRIP and coiled-coil domain-containing protein 1 [Rhagoletis zephyria]|uniref:GRIP and coiled-coil domain-containing protein 1 n=1 Tax=Rhagoletis zephyria TaxID=28612 RepID=UPI0008113EC0|nr:PREDICTED: GRIP and coiled-coil domain-containing protein 1 [Rhagoletis zephyria]